METEMEKGGFFTAPGEVYRGMGRLEPPEQTVLYTMGKLRRPAWRTWNVRQESGNSMLFDTRNDLCFVHLICRYWVSPLCCG